MAAASVLTTLTLLFSPSFFSATSATLHGFPFGVEKRTHFHFFFQDVVSGPKPTAVRVASAGTMKNSPTGFGVLLIADDPMTETPGLDSRLVGRAEGLYASMAQDEVALLMIFNLVFLSGEYNGSSLTMVGRNQVFSEVREMPVVGGTGKLRMARGYALARTHRLNATTGDATVEYNVFVMHH